MVASDHPPNNNCMKCLCVLWMSKDRLLSVIYIRPWAHGKVVCTSQSYWGTIIYTAISSGGTAFWGDHQMYDNPTMSNL